MKLRELCITRNTLTNVKTFFASDRSGKLGRISKETYDMLNDSAIRKDCFHSKSYGKFEKKFHTVYF